MPAEGVDTASENMRYLYTLCGFLSPTLAIMVASSLVFKPLVDMVANYCTQKLGSTDSITAVPRDPQVVTIGHARMRDAHNNYGRDVCHESFDDFENGTKDATLIASISDTWSSNEKRGSIY